MHCIPDISRTVRLLAEPKSVRIVFTVTGVAEAPTCPPETGIGDCHCSQPSNGRHDYGGLKDKGYVATIHQHRLARRSADKL